MGLMFTTWPIWLRLNNPGRDRQQHNSETDIEMGDRNLDQTGDDDIWESVVVASFVYGDEEEEEDGEVKCRSSNYNECAICWEDFVDGKMCRVLPACNHVFHKSCVGLWLMEKRVCPLCRVCVEI